MAARLSASRRTSVRESFFGRTKRGVADYLRRLQAGDLFVAEADEVLENLVVVLAEQRRGHTGAERRPGIAEGSADVGLGADHGPVDILNHAELAVVLDRPGFTAGDDREGGDAGALEP